MRRLFILATLIALVGSGRPQGAGQDMVNASDDTIWMRSAASQWDHAFPVGNGRLGAMVLGTVNRERIQLNDETLWMGGPRETDNPEAREALPQVRRLLFEGKPTEAYALAERKLMGKPWRLESYQSLADLRLNFDTVQVIARRDPKVGPLFRDIILTDLDRGTTGEALRFELKLSMKPNP